MSSLGKLIRELRPRISDSSIKTYVSSLSSLFKKVYGSGEVDPEKFVDSSKILSFLKDMPPARRKSILAALVVITNGVPAYRDQMQDDIAVYQHDVQKQSKNEKQEAYWMEPSAIDDKLAQLKTEALYLLKKKTLSMIDLQQIQNWVILSLYWLQVPRRSLDYCLMKWRGDVGDKDNSYNMKKGTFRFVSYKTQRIHGVQTMQAPKDLRAALTKWLKKNPTDFLLFDSQGHQLTPTTLNQRLNKIFGKKLSTSGLRHIFLSSKYGHIIEMEKNLTADLAKMGSSDMVAKNYVIR